MSLRMRNFSLVLALVWMPNDINLTKVVYMAKDFSLMMTLFGFVWRIRVAHSSVKGVQLQ